MLEILQRKFYTERRNFAPDEEMLEALQKSGVWQGGKFEETQKMCMPFLKFKKDEAIAVGVQATCIGSEAAIWRHGSFG